MYNCDCIVVETGNGGDAVDDVAESSKYADSDKSVLEADEVAGFMISTASDCSGCTNVVEEITG